MLHRGRSSRSPFTDGWLQQRGPDTERSYYADDNGFGASGQADLRRERPARSTQLNCSASCSSRAWSSTRGYQFAVLLSPQFAR